MNMLPALFYFFIALAALSAAGILFSKNVFKSALYLLTCLLSIAALYVLSLAEFLAVAQILVYAGGILVLIIFGVMLTTRITGQPLIVKNANVAAGMIGSLSFLALLLGNLTDPGDFEHTHVGPVDAEAVGLTLFSQHVLPFEIAGVLLLIALVGAAVVTSQQKSPSDDRR